MESVRVQLSGNRIKAYGRIVAAATGRRTRRSARPTTWSPTNSGATKRLSLTVTLAERERQLSIARDEENMWLVQDHQNQTKRAAYDGALDVDVIFSPFFNALPIRRTGLYQRADVDHAARGLRAAARPDGRAGDHQLQQRRSRRHQAAVAGRRHHDHRRRRRASSSTTPDWQSGSDHPAGAAGGGEFVAPVVLRRW